MDVIARHPPWRYLSLALGTRHPTRSLCGSFFFGPLRIFFF